MRLIFSALVALLCSLSVHAFDVPELQGRLQLIRTPNPNGHEEFVVAMSNAKASIQMQMYNLTEPGCINALKAAAQRGVDVRMIMDRANMEKPKALPIIEDMKKAGVQIVASSPFFSLTHSKSMIVDAKIAFVTAINLTKLYSVVRDYGVITEDQNIIAEMNAVFSADWSNAQNDGGVTPDLKSKNLVWSPINSKSRLIDLIRSAQERIDLTVENFSDPGIQGALGEVAARGIPVRVILPMCDMASDPLFNYPMIARLQALHVDVRVMPAPATVEHPYMHSKMILVDGARAYVGSENFSFNSLLKAREVGLIFAHPDLAHQLSEDFESDWSLSVPAPNPLPEAATCAPLAPK